MDLETRRQVIALKRTALRLDVCFRKDGSGAAVPMTSKGPDQLDAEIFCGRTANMSLLKALEFCVRR